jgi:hypothetical protein
MAEVARLMTLTQDKIAKELGLGGGQVYFIVAGNT